MFVIHFAWQVRLSGQNFPFSCDQGHDGRAGIWERAAKEQRDTLKSFPLPGIAVPLNQYFRRENTSISYPGFSQAVMKN